MSAPAPGWATERATDWGSGSARGSGSAKATGSGWATDSAQARRSDRSRWLLRLPRRRRHCRRRTRSSAQPSRTHMPAPELNAGYSKPSVTQPSDSLDGTCAWQAVLGTACDDLRTAVQGGINRASCSNPPPTSGACGKHSAGFDRNKCASSGCRVCNQSRGHSVSTIANVNPLTRGSGTIWHKAVMTRLRADTTSIDVGALLRGPIDPLVRPGMYGTVTGDLTFCAHAQRPPRPAGRLAPSNNPAVFS